MTEMSGARDSSEFDCNTILLGNDIGYNQSLSMRGDNDYVFISGFENIKNTIEDKTIDFISLMGINIIPTAIAVEKYTYFISDHYKFIENKKIAEGTLLDSTNDSLDHFDDHHLAKCGEGAFKTMECNQIHSFYPNEEAEDDEQEDIWRTQRELDDRVEEQKNLDKPAYCNGNNEMVKLSNQKCYMF